MSEIFRERVVESPVAPENDLQSTPPRELVSDELKGNEIKVGEESTSDEKTLDVWEGLNRRKYITEYFNIKEFSEEFSLKMQTATIDKYIKGELEKRKYEKNIDNYNSILKELEEEIGSGRMELFERIRKITGYAKAISRLNESKEKLKLYQLE